MNELYFRLIALGAAVAYFTIRSVWERKLRRPSKAEQMKAIPTRERLPLYVVAVGMLPMWAYMLTPYVDFARLGLPAPVRLAGLAAALAGMVTLHLSHRDLGSSWSPFVEKPADGLVTSGVYRFVRHPMYASFFLFDTGILLLTSNWLAGVPAVLGMLYLYVSRVDAEERMMLDLFGDEYRRYAAGTGRVVPGVGCDRLAGTVPERQYVMSHPVHDHRAHIR